MEKKLPLYEMMIGDTIEGEEEVDFIALVEYPAIQKNFLAFSQDFQEDSYNDYPQSAKDNAERGIRLNEEIGNRCATQVGKVRATQIMNGENLSRETIRRTYSYLSRAAEYYNPEDTEACGTISYLLWGGEPMLRWAESKMNQEDFRAVGFNKFSIENQDQRIVTGPLMVADLPIYRRDQDEEYYVSFSAAEIKKIVQRFFKKGYQSKVNVEHSTPVDGVFMFESYIIDSSDVSGSTFLAGFNFSINTGSNNARTTKFLVTNTGNVLIGSTTDSGEKLQVTGTMKVTGNFVGGAIVSYIKRFILFVYVYSGI